jgi:hypothetical protein
MSTLDFVVRQFFCCSKDDNSSLFYHPTYLASNLSIIATQLSKRAASLLHNAASRRRRLLTLDQTIEEAEDYLSGHCCTAPHGTRKLWDGSREISFLAT